MGCECSRADQQINNEGKQEEEEENISESQDIPISGSQILEQPKIKNRLDNFLIIKCIGRGSFGKVMLVQQQTSGRYFAMKSIRKKNMQNKRGLQKQTKNEKSILQQIDHPFIVKLHYAFQTNSKLYMIMDFVNGGELFYHLRRVKSFTEDQVKFYAAEIFLALEYLHNNNIVFRDLKPENILFDHQGHIKLTDFGMAKQIVGDHTYTICGTPEYFAPELIKGLGSSFTADWWSFGIIIYEMLVGNHPFYNKNRKILMNNILRPQQRLGSDGSNQIRSHPFFNKIDWQQMEQKQVQVPWQPELTGQNDLKYIDNIYQKEMPIDTQLTDQFNPSQDNFKDYTYEKPQSQVLLQQDDE